ncbi:MAG: site-specific DNA-methyltransferase [Leptospiraceae bacterium]|nr:site-specific DNA-methyltransferase [Leptospiraceae bacterium]MCP5498496.1 site-specific DNA-methyltransferase [Leptospiraceae bacterium]
MVSSNHKILIHDSRSLSEIVEPDSIDLVVTSPPYPMIQMWDELFFKMNTDIQKILEQNPSLAFELMNQEMDKVWESLYHSIKDGGFLIINIGDATRTINGDFQLFSNHARIIQKCLQLDFKNLPNILWRKQTNAPNKFMGSGMLPAGAYVTLEHEYILIFRKGTKKNFNNKQKDIRRESSYFWEERNIWFSDIWEDVKGTKQLIKNTETRNRSAAYPFELVYRLINMYSCKGDTVLDPFWGTGTTTLAAIASERNSIGIELEPYFKKEFLENTDSYKNSLNEYLHKRIEKHREFVKNRLESGKEIKHHNDKMNFPVMTSQEKELIINEVESIQNNDDIEVKYSELLNTPTYNFPNGNGKKKEKELTLF